MIEEVRWVKLVFVDVFGGAHAVTLPADRFDTALENGAPFDGSALEGRARHLEADMILQPDAATMRRMGDGHARVACRVLGPDRSPAQDSILGVGRRHGRMWTR